MAKIVINKNFQSKYLYRAYERLVKPDYDNTKFVIIAWTGNPPSYSSVDFSDRCNQSYYGDLSSAYSTSWAGCPYQYLPDDKTSVIIPYQYFICDETFITLLNKINTLIKNGMDSLPKVPKGVYPKPTITPDDLVANVNLVLLTASLFSAKQSVREGVIDYFVLSDIITVDEGATIKNTYSGLKLHNQNVNLDSYGNTYVIKNTDILSTVSNGKIDITSSGSFKLDNPYKQVDDNPSNNKMYLIAIPFADSKFVDGNNQTILWYSSASASFPVDTGVTNYPSSANNQNSYAWYESSTGIAKVGYNTFHNKATNTVVNQIPYIALSLTETGMGGDIEYDHLDEIEYLDEIKISMTLPKEYV